MKEIVRKKKIQRNGIYLGSSLMEMMDWKESDKIKLVVKNNKIIIEKI